MANRSDNFDRTAGAIGTPSDGGSAWAFYGGSGAWSTTGTEGYTSAAGAQTLAVLDASSSAVEVQVTLTTVGTGPGLSARVVSANSHLLVSIEPSVPRARLYKKTGSVTFVQLGSTYSGSFSNGDVLLLSADASDNITFKQNGVTRIGPSPDSYNNTATEHGLRNNSETNSRYDDFTITDLAGGGSTADGDLESDGTSTATATGASLASGNASSTGTGSATATGAALASVALSAFGSGSANFVGDSEAAGFEDGDLSATGTGSASAVGASLASGVLSAAGSATATFVGDSEAAGVEEGDLSAAGTGTATLGGAAVAAGAFSMAGTSSAEFRGASEGGTVATRHEGRRPRVNVVEMNNRRMRQWAFVANAVIQRAA